MDLGDIYLLRYWDIMVSLEERIIVDNLDMKIIPARLDLTFGLDPRHKFKWTYISDNVKHMNSGFNS